MQWGCFYVIISIFLLLQVYRLANFAGIFFYFLCWLSAPYDFENGSVGPAQRSGKNCFVVPLHFFGFFGSKSTVISRFGERFRDGQYSLVSFLFAVSLVAVPLCPTESAPLAP